MGKKILIIDDSPLQFKKIKKWIGNIGFNAENVIPNTKEGIKEMQKASKSDEEICEFVEKQIKQNYKDLVLILCDLLFKGDPDRGNAIVTHIRQKINYLTPPNWASMVPIIGMTKFADNKTNLDAIIEIGADYGFEKKIIEDNSEECIKERTTLKKIIKTQVQKFERNLDSIYPSGLKDKIIGFKNQNKGNKTAFIMTDFRHLETAKEVRKILNDNKIHGFIANAPGGKYDETIWENIQVFMHGCDFGIAIYADDSAPTSESEKIRNMINANLCIEVGYMRGLQKLVLSLRESSLDYRDLPSDFQGKNTTEFNDDFTLEVNLTELLKNRGLIEKKE